MRRAKPVLAIAGALALAGVLSGCVAIKSGSYSLSQPAGIGPVTMKFTLCTLNGEPAEASTTCGAIPAGEGAQAQLMVGLTVPPGASTPESFSAVPAPGSPSLTFTRNAEASAQMSANVADFVRSATGVPAGFELAGYISETITEVEGQALEWTLEPGVGLPPAADGGSSGAPLAAFLVSGWRNVEAGLPASRPIECDTEGKTPNTTFCGAILPESEATLGVSDLKVQPPAESATVPGKKVKLPFVLDFASSAAKPPKFALAAGTTLPGAGLSLSNASFGKAPSNPTTHRAPPTTRKAIVQVPASARLGSYEVSLTATAAQGGVVRSSTVLRVEPKGKPKVKAPGKVKARIAYRRGIPVTLSAPIAATRFQLLLKGPRPNGKGRMKLRKRVVKAKQLGSSTLRLKLPRRRVEALLAIGKPLRLQARVRVPGKQKPLRLGRSLTLR